MQVTNPEQLFELKENEFIGELPTLTNSQINFNGINNILFWFARKGSICGTPE